MQATPNYKEKRTLLMSIPNAFSEVYQAAKMVEIKNKEWVDAHKDGTSVSEGLESYEYSKEAKSKLHEAIVKLNGDDLKELIGWYTFGRDYLPGHGDPQFELAAAIRLSSVENRREAEVYISSKPIATYLRDAERKLKRA